MESASWTRKLWDLKISRLFESFFTSWNKTLKKSLRPIVRRNFQEFSFEPNDFLTLVVMYRVLGTVPHCVGSRVLSHKLINTSQDSQQVREYTDASSLTFCAKDTRPLIYALAWTCFFRNFHSSFFKTSGTPWQGYHSIQVKPFENFSGISIFQFREGCTLNNSVKMWCKKLQKVKVFYFY